MRSHPGRSGGAPPARAVVARDARRRRGPGRPLPPPAPTIPGVQELEFTVEPFVEGHPGPHVTAAVEAATVAGAEVEFGPFGSSCRVDDDVMPDVVAAI